MSHAVSTASPALHKAKRTALQRFRSPERLAAMVAAIVQRFGALHIAHLNAGIETVGTIFKTTPEQWDSVLDVNLRGTFFGLKFAGRQIVASGGGSVIITSSGAGLLGAARGSAYTASKHGVLGLMKCASAELAPLGVRVNAICPGIIDTPMLGSSHVQNQVVASVLGASQPIGRLGTAVEVAKLVVFLAGAEASFITGSTIPVDGGVSSVFGSFTKEVRSTLATGAS